jgi:Acyl-CoA dehydrogenase, C-terminal domain
MDQSDIELFERSIRQATERSSGEALDAALAEVGWLDALSLDPHVAVSTLFSQQGSAHVTSSALDWLLTSVLGLEHDPALAVVLPSLGSWDAPAQVGTGISVRGLGTAALRRAERAVVVLKPGDDGSCGVLTVETTDLQLRSVEGMDPDFGLVEVAAASGALDHAPRETTDRWATAVMMAQLALSHELVGAARAMLRLAREHALERIQFGQPIAGFQAVRHRLAETLVAIETADSVLAAAWDDSSRDLAATSKALAGRGAKTAARHCQQVLAGIGFTAEHHFHRYYKRILILDQLFGSARALTENLGRELLATRRLPQLLAL